MRRDKVSLVSVLLRCRSRAGRTTTRWQPAVVWPTDYCRQTYSSELSKPSRLDRAFRYEPRVIHPLLARSRWSLPNLPTCKSALWRRERPEFQAKQPVYLPFRLNFSPPKFTNEVYISIEYQVIKHQLNVTDHGNEIWWKDGRHFVGGVCAPSWKHGWENNTHTKHYYVNRFKLAGLSRQRDGCACNLPCNSRKQAQWT